MAVSRREAVDLSGSALAALSVGALTRGTLQAQASAAAPAQEHLPINPRARGGLRQKFNRAQIERLAPKDAVVK